MADRPVSVKLAQPLRSKDVKVRPAAKQIWKEKTVTCQVTEMPTQKIQIRKNVNFVHNIQHFPFVTENEMVQESLPMKLKKNYYYFMRTFQTVFLKQFIFDKYDMPLSGNLTDKDSYKGPTSHSYTSCGILFN